MAAITVRKLTASGRQGTGATRSGRTAVTIGDGATSAVFAVYETNREDGSADLDSARALIPAVILGVAFWAIILAIAVLIWG